jgi:hypothetical protein
MVDQKETAVAKTAWTVTLPTPIAYEFKWKTYADDAEFLATPNAALTTEEQRKVRDNEAKNNARQQALALALKEAGYERPTAENNEQVRLKDMFKVLMTSKKYTEAQAREIAANTLGLVWAD